MFNGVHTAGLTDSISSQKWFILLVGGLRKVIVMFELRRRVYFAIEKLFRLLRLVR